MPSYTLNNINIYDYKNLENFLLNCLPATTRYNSLSYDYNSKTLIITTKEANYSSETENVINNLVRDKYPNPPIASNTQWNKSDVEVLNQNASVYGYFSPSTAIDGDVIISTNTSLTRNMYYQNLTVNTGVTLNSNGWRIVVIDTLTLYGSISFDGGHASGSTPGTGSSLPLTTYLGGGTNGAPGINNTGNGLSGEDALYSCTGGVGGTGGNISTYKGGNPGAYMPIAAIDGGINILSTMPIAFLGRVLSKNYYLIGGTGGGSGAALKGTAKTISSGAGGSGAGLIVVAARRVVGTGAITAKGGNGGTGTFVGTMPSSGFGLGPGNGGGGGCLILISQSGIPDTINLNVDGGMPGIPIGAALPGNPGGKGNIFKINV